MDEVQQVLVLGMGMIGLTALFFIFTISLLVKGKKKSMKKIGMDRMTSTIDALITYKSNFANVDKNFAPTGIICDTTVEYEFYVNGKKYTGRGIGSDAYWEKNNTTVLVYYNPNHPESNCTSVEMELGTGSTAHRYLKHVLIFLTALIALMFCMLIFIP